MESGFGQFFVLRILHIAGRFNISDPIHQTLKVLQILMKTDVFSNTANCPLQRIDFISVKKL